MARVELAVTQIVAAGVANPAGVSGTNQGVKFQNNGHCFLEVQNTDGAADYAVTLEVPYTVGGLTVQPYTIVIPHGSAWYKLGPFPVLYFDQAAGGDVGEVYVDFAVGHEAVFTVRAFRLWA